MKPYNDNHSDSEVSLPGPEQENSLTPMKRMLLRESRKESKRLKYEFPGYIVNGQI